LPAALLLLAEDLENTLWLLSKGTKKDLAPFGKGFFWRKANRIPLETPA
jgi:hypothetical protein